MVAKPPEPAPVEVAEPVEEESVLPEIEAKPEPGGEIASSDALDELFNNLEVDAAPKAASKKKAAEPAAPPVSNDIDLDDIIGSFG